MCSKEYMAGNFLTNRRLTLLVPIILLFVLVSLVLKCFVYYWKVFLIRRMKNWIPGTTVESLGWKLGNIACSLICILFSFIFPINYHVYSKNWGQICSVGYFDKNISFKIILREVNVKNVGEMEQNCSKQKL